MAAVAVIGAGVYGVSHMSQPAAGPGENSQPSVSVSDGSTSVPNEEEDPADLALEQALAQYRIIVSQANSYSYSPYQVTPTGNYRYALVQLEAGDPVPTLLLSQEEDNYSDLVLLFQYDPETDQVIHPEESLEEYSGGGGYASGLSLQGDGMGLGLSEIAGGTGSTVMTRITLQNGALVREEQWSGRMDAADSETPDFIDIPWHDISDLSALDSWTPEPGDTPAGRLLCRQQYGKPTSHRRRPHRLYRHGGHLQLRRGHCPPGLPRSQRPLVRLQPDLPSHCAGYPPGDGIAVRRPGKSSQKRHREPHFGCLCRGTGAV